MRKPRATVYRVVSKISPFNYDHKATEIELKEGCVVLKNNSTTVFVIPVALLDNINISDRRFHVVAA